MKARAHGRDPLLHAVRGNHRFDRTPRVRYAKRIAGPSFPNPERFYVRKTLFYRGCEQIPDLAHSSKPVRHMATSFADANYTIPSSSAFRTARVRSRTPSLDRMLDTWFLTVPSATLSELAISLLL